MECTTKLPKHRVYMSAAARRKHAIEDATRWNAAHDVGAAVCVHRDNGEIVRTTTRSAASITGETAVVWVDGISGCYALFRVHAARSDP